MKAILALMAAFVLVPVRAAHAQEGLPRVTPTPAIIINTVRFEGASALSQADLEAVAAPYLRRPLTAAGLEALRRAVSQAYVDRGYLNSGARLPDQDIGDGVLLVEIIEGRLSDITLKTDRRLLRERLVTQPFLGLLKSAPLSTEQLETAFQTALRDPLVERLNAELAPGAAPGEADLRLDATLAEPFEVFLGVDNHNAPAAGEFAGFASGRFINALGFGERATARVIVRGGAVDGGGRGEVPLFASGSSAYVEGRRAEIRLIELPIDDVESDFWSLEAGVRQSLWRRPRWSVESSAGLGVARGRTTVSGLGFPFAEGVEADGSSATTTVNLGLAATYGGDRLGSAFRSRMRIGLDAFDATVNDDGPDGRFVSWLLQGELRARPFEDGRFQDLDLVLQTDAQFADSRLLPIARFAVGGARSVRGFRENALVRDQGWRASFEVRHPLFRLPVPGVVSAARSEPLRLGVFVDHASARNIQGPGDDRDRLTSVGAALYWTPVEWLSAELAYAYGLTASPTSGGALQDDGVHIRFVFGAVAAAKALRN